MTSREQNGSVQTRDFHRRSPIRIANCACFSIYSVIQSSLFWVTTEENHDAMAGLVPASSAALGACDRRRHSPLARSNGGNAAGASAGVEVDLADRAQRRSQQHAG